MKAIMVLLLTFKCLLGFDLLDNDQASGIKQAEMTPADMSLDSTMYENQIISEQNPVLQETNTLQTPLLSILNIIRMPLQQNTVELNPISQNTNEQVSPSITVEELPSEMVSLYYDNEAPPNQSGDPAMPSPTDEYFTAVNEESLQQYALQPILNEDQENASAKPIVAAEGNQEVQLDYNQNVSTIEIPLITDPNSTPELVKFRPGVYEGDAIPPVYSDFSIFAVAENYVPQIPEFVQPEMTIIPEPIYEEQVITENLTTNDDEEFIESDDGDNFVADSQEHQLAVENAQVSDQLMNPRQTAFPEGRIVDARLLVTLRNTRLILIYKGYHFRRYYCQGLKIRWQCVDQKCSAYLYSYENKVTVTNSVHNHLKIITKNYSLDKPTESKAVYSLEEAINTVTDLGPVIDQHIDPSDRGAINIETMTLSYTNEPISSSVETASQTSPTQNENLIPLWAPKVFWSGNTTIYHDPSLEITVKETSRDFSENDKSIPHAMISGSENIVTSLPDPLDYCVTSYEPTTSQNPATIGSSHEVHSSYNDMSVPKEVKAKVTLTPIPQIFKPQVYYDGKLSQPRATQGINSKEFIPTTTCTMTSTTPALSSYNPRDAAFIPRPRSAGEPRGSISLLRDTAPLRVLESHARISRVINK